MVLSVRRDLLYTNHGTGKSENIQENAKSSVNKLREKTEENRGKQVLRDISDVMNVPAKHFKTTEKHQHGQLQMS